MQKIKKGLSDIVATVLLISMVLIAVSIVGVFVNNNAKKVMNSPEMSCLDLQLHPPITISDQCFNKSTGDIVIPVSRRLDSKVDSIDFIVSYQGHSDVYEVGGSCKNCILPEHGQGRVYYINANATSITSRVQNCDIETKQVLECK